MPSTDSYTAAMIKDAGGRYVYSGNNSGQSLPVDMETAAILTAQSQIWLTGSQATTIEGLRHPPKNQILRHGLQQHC